jgi:hypothetical protein
MSFFKKILKLIAMIVAIIAIIYVLVALLVHVGFLAATQGGLYSLGWLSAGASMTAAGYAIVAAILGVIAAFISPEGFAEVVGNASEAVASVVGGVTEAAATIGSTLINTGVNSFLKNPIVLTAAAYAAYKFVNKEKILTIQGVEADAINS